MSDNSDIEIDTVAFNLLFQNASSAGKITNAQHLISKGAEMMARGQKLLAEAWSEIHLQRVNTTSVIPVSEIEMDDVVSGEDVVANGGGDSVKTPKRKRAKITDPHEKELMAKKRTSGYLLFCQEYRHNPSLIEECPDNKMRMAFIADKWKHLDQNSKKVYEDRAEKIRNEASVQQEGENVASAAEVVVAAPVMSTPVRPQAVELAKKAASMTPVSIEKTVQPVAPVDVTPVTAVNAAAEEESKKSLKKEKKHKHHGDDKSAEKKKHKKKKSLGNTGTAAADTSILV